VAELATIPGNGFTNLRQIIATSQNGGDACFVHKLCSGSSEGHLLFGDRQGGIYKFNLFEPSLPSWNCAVLGGPGSGKSLMMNLQIISLAQYPSQIYVIDIGNSFGTVFNFLELANPGKVSTMRVEGGDFAFNPLPLVKALQEREKQIEDGTYKEILRVVTLV
jgi:type IV secretory pathway VirB4 component